MSRSLHAYSDSVPADYVHPDKRQRLSRGACCQDTTRNGALYDYLHYQGLWLFTRMFQFRVLAPQFRRHYLSQQS